MSLVWMRHVGIPEQSFCIIYHESCHTYKKIHVTHLKRVMSPTWNAYSKYEGCHLCECDMLGSQDSFSVSYHEPWRPYEKNHSTHVKRLFWNEVCHLCECDMLGSQSYSSVLYITSHGTHTKRIIAPIWKSLGSQISCSVLLLLIQKES